MGELLPLDGVKIFLHIRECVAPNTSSATATISSGAYVVNGPRRASGSADAVRRRTRTVVKQLGGTLCLSEREAHMVLCYHATTAYIQEALRIPQCQALDPAYVEACLESHKKVDPGPFTLVWRSGLAATAAAVDPAGEERVVDRRGRSRVTASPPRAATAGISASSPHKGPVKHVSQTAFAFDKEVSPDTRAFTRCAGPPNSNEAPSLTPEATTPPLPSAQALHHPRPSAHELAITMEVSDETFNTPTLASARVPRQPVDLLPEGGASTSTMTLTQTPGSTPPYIATLPQPVSMEEVRHALLRASAQATEHIRHDRKRGRESTNAKCEDEDTETRPAQQTSDEAVRSSPSLSSRPQEPPRRSRGDPFLLSLTEEAPSTLHSRTPTPRVTQQLASTLSCSPAQTTTTTMTMGALLTDSDRRTVPSYPESAAPSGSTAERARAQKRPTASQKLARVRKATQARAAAPALSVKPKKSSPTQRKPVLKMSSAAAHVRKKTIKPHEALSAAQAAKEVVAPVAEAAVASLALSLPPGLRPLPLYDAAGSFHPRRSLRIGLISDVRSDSPDNSGSARISSSLWSDVIEQLGARFVDLPGQDSNRVAATPSLDRRQRPNILVAPAESELTVDVVLAKALGIRIVLPQWLDDAILLGDFPEVLPDRHAHPLFGREDASQSVVPVASAPSRVTTAPHVAVTEVLTPRFPEEAPPMELLGVTPSDPRDSREVEGTDDVDDEPGESTARRSEVDEEKDARPPPSRRARAAKEVQFLQRTTADEFLPVGEQWERPFFRPIFRDMMFYLRSAEEIESADAHGGAGGATLSGRKRRTNATHEAVVTLELVAHIIRTLGGTVTRNLASPHLDVVLDLIVDFGQLASEIGLQAATDSRCKPVAAPPLSSHKSGSGGPIAARAVPCASLSLVYQHTLTCMATYSQLQMANVDTPPPITSPSVSERPQHDGAAVCAPDGAPRGGVETDVHSDNERPPLAVVGVPWLIYSVLTRQCADIKAFASVRPPPSRTSPAQSTSSRRVQTRTSRKKKVSDSPAANTPKVASESPRTPSPPAVHTSQTAAAPRSPERCPDAFSPSLPSPRRSPPRQADAHQVHCESPTTSTVAGFSRSFVSPMAKTRASEGAVSPASLTDRVLRHL